MQTELKRELLGSTFLGLTQVTGALSVWTKAANQAPLSMDMEGVEPILIEGFVERTELIARYDSG